MNETPPPPLLSQAKIERVERELLKDFALKSSDEVGDLSSKVGFLMMVFKPRIDQMPFSIGLRFVISLKFVKTQLNNNNNNTNITITTITITIIRCPSLWGISPSWRLMPSSMQLTTPF